ncbi:BREX system serine/threonine kinase PglW [Cryobacterium sp. N19]|uniref:BREX system serine/threonine kinase PglW n=1 Tax=Cryobacterium sp. N19 TaxID=2048288 RepID=UPI000CE4DF56|nr:BREX system serine/threonine kinase PglW [Cryobacterium sp. N19]
MQEDSNHWVAFGVPATPAEGVALDILRDLLPDAAGITHAWANLTFVSDDGRTDEIDVLLLTKNGLFLVELKGWHGTITGNGGAWNHNNGRVTRSVRNPYILVDQKARRLSSLLKTTANTIPGKPAIPFIRSLVVLHGRDSRISLDEAGQAGVWALDGYNVEGLGQGRLFSDFLKLPAHDERSVIDGPRANALRKVAAEAGFSAIPVVRMAGIYSLEKTDPIGEGEGWQDVLASHPTLPLKRRVRLFNVPPGASKETRTEIERNAKREVMLTSGFTHPGITVPTEYVDANSGPALVFNYEPDAISLDAFIASDGSNYALADRIVLIRKIAEVLRYAHGRSLVHRTLTPRQVFVTHENASISVSIRDWMSGKKRAGTLTTTQTIMSGGATDVSTLIDAESWNYLAPETLQGNATAPIIPLDVYGVGVLSYLILTGRPPVSTFTEQQNRFADSDSFNPLAVSPELPEAFAALVERATRFVEADRTASIEVFLAELDAAVGEFTQRSETDERPVAADPLDAETGAELAQRFDVLGRRGSGSTGIALHVDDYVTTRVGLILKLARDDAAASRMSVEADSLRTLDHPRIVRLIEGPIDVDGRTGILMTDAGRETLADRLQTEGRSTIEQLEQYGDDLFEAMRYLEEQGVFHRDIKPANLAVSPDPASRKPRLTLFDFSLAREPLANITSGSRPYLDPYLGQGRRRQYDRAAELYAVAVTLFEMAAATPPWWENGESAPLNAADRVVLMESTFEKTVAAPLVTFFTTALAADTANRFTNATDMSVAWRQVFSTLASESSTVDTDESAREDKASLASLDTPLAESGLSPRALSGISRLGVRTVGELLGRPISDINTIRGLGERYRKEVKRRMREWNPRLRPNASPPEVVEMGRRESVERRSDRLISRPTANNTNEVAALHLLLGKPRDVDDVVPEWPTLSAIAASIGVTPGRVSQLLDAATQRWRKAKYLTTVIDDVVSIVTERGRVATLDEVASALLFLYGSSVEGPNRVRRATGLIRAAIELDARASVPQLAVKRSRANDTPVLIAVTDGAGSGSNPGSAETLLTTTRRMAQLVDEATAQNPITAAASMRAALLRETPDRLTLDDQRLLQLAVAASNRASLSSLDEVYRRDLAPADAVEASLAGIAVRELTEDGIRRRVQLRFPLINTIPARPGLDEVVKRTHPHFAWKVDRFTIRDSTLSGGESSTRFPTAFQTTPLPEIDRVLRSSLERHSALTLAVHPSRYRRAALLLHNSFNARTIDLAAELVTSVRETAAAKGAKWDVILRADVDETSLDFRRLTGLAKQSMTERWREITALPEPLLLLNAAPMARYGMTDLLAELMDLARPRPAARWLLVPWRKTLIAPDLDGRPVPFGPDKWLTLPNDLRELFPLQTGEIA